MSIKGFSVGGNVERYDYNFLDNLPSEITIDTALSDSSTNPVQNRVVTSAINSANGSISSISGEVDDLKSAFANMDGFTPEIKSALMAVVEHIGAWSDGNAQTYIQNLRDALYPSEPPAELVSISAVFTQGDNIIYDTDALDTLKQYLVVTAHYDDSSTATVASADYALSGTLTEGTSTITVTYGDKTDMFDVLVTSSTVSVAMNSAYSYGSGQAYSDGGETTLNTANTEMTSTSPISTGVVRIRVTNDSGNAIYGGPYIGLSDTPVTGNNQSPTITYARLYNTSETSSGRTDHWGNGVSLDITYTVEDAGKYLIIYSTGSYASKYNALTWEIQFEGA